MLNQLGSPSKYSECRAFIRGSDARIIMGDDEGALLRLWREKRSEVEPEDLSGNLAVQLGQRQRTEPALVPGSDGQGCQRRADVAAPSDATLDGCDPRRSGRRRRRVRS